MFKTNSQLDKIIIVYYPRESRCCYIIRRGSILFDSILNFKNLLLESILERFRDQSKVFRLVHNVVFDALILKTNFILKIFFSVNFAVFSSLSLNGQFAAKYF